MNYAIVIFLFCQFSAEILNYTKSVHSNAIEVNSQKMSPTEKIKLERKIAFFGFFAKFLRYGSAVYVVLSTFISLWIPK